MFGVLLRVQNSYIDHVNFVNLIRRKIMEYVGGYWNKNEMVPRLDGHCKNATVVIVIPDSKVHVAYMGPMNFAIADVFQRYEHIIRISQIKTKFYQH